MATVVHILDSRTGGSLVAHIKVGETYHQRKEVSEIIRGRDTPGGSHWGVPGLSLSWVWASVVSCHFSIHLFSVSSQGVTHQQWYLFNDFLIEPIDKVSCNTFRSPFHLPLSSRSHPHPRECHADSGGRRGSLRIKSVSRIKNSTWVLSFVWLGKKEKGTYT